MDTSVSLGLRSRAGVAYLVGITLVVATATSLLCLSSRADCAAAAPSSARFDVLKMGDLWNEKYALAAMPPSDTDWRTLATGEKLTPTEVENLHKNKILVSNRSCRQVFAPYLHSSLTVPVFITSDSLINGYHVLLEESVVRMERSSVAPLDEVLRSIWGNLAAVERGARGDPDCVNKAMVRARIVIGTAMSLLGGKVPPCDAGIVSLIQEEVERVTKACDRQKPVWLGSPDPGFVVIDYSRFRPRGLYADIPGMASYFQAVSWLQSIPFRLDRDEEFLSILIIANAIADSRLGDDQARRERFKTVFCRYRQLIGENDDWDIITVNDVIPKGSNLDLRRQRLADLRKLFLKKAAETGYRPLLNDQVRYPIRDDRLPLELGFRVLSAYRTPDAVFFERITNQSDRQVVSGLQLCKALTSSPARVSPPRPLSGATASPGDLFTGDSVYCQYLQCLSTLLMAPPMGAPAFMNNEPWHVKSCQTSLGGWAQLRHTWALQEKRSDMVLGAGSPDRPAGFVEPNPAFFGQFADAISKTHGVLKRTGSFTLQSTPQDLVPDLQRLIEILKRESVKGKKTFQLRFLALDLLDGLRFARLLAFIRRRTSSSQSLADRTRRPSDLLPEEVIADFHDLPVEECINLLTQAVDDLSRGKMRNYPELSVADFGLVPQYPDLSSRWEVLETICRQCQAVANKQLRGEDLAEKETRFLLNFGDVLSRVMFHYWGESGLARDNAPRVVDVSANPNVNTYLEVGIGYPRFFYVLYPYKGREVLCRGAVLPYYEFAHPTRLNDFEWRELLDSPNSPSLPEWVRPIYGSAPIGKRAERY